MVSPSVIICSLGLSDIMWATLSDRVVGIDVDGGGCCRRIPL